MEEHVNPWLVSPDVMATLLKSTTKSSTPRKIHLPECTTHQRQQRETYSRQAPSQRICLLGLEMRPELVWDNWELQREFTKALVIKNVHTKLQKLHVRPPISKFFTTLTPQTIAVSPGTSFSMPVYFKPLQRCEYEDSIEFQGKDGSFQVRLRAILPCHALEVPDTVLLPLCAVQHSTQTSFLLRNISKLQTCFQWECVAPFQLSPEQGLLNPGQESHITVVFRPLEALVYQQQANCRFGEEGDKTNSCCSVLLKGQAKHPCLQLRSPGATDGKHQNDPVLHFESEAVGQSLQKHFDIFNPSPVAASFSLSLPSDWVSLLGSEFICDVTSGEVAPGRLIRATVTYTPAVVDAVTVEYLSLECRGAPNETQVKLIGKCAGPKLSLSTSVLDFGCVEEGGAVAQTFELVNSSPVEAFYQWDLDCTGHSVFSIQPASGTVRPNSRTTLEAVYRPTQPITHHRSVACLILHRDPVFLDLIGTCHSELQQPAILKPEHLVLYKLNWDRGQDQPDTVSDMQQDHNVQLDQQGKICPPEKRPDIAGVSRVPMDDYYQSCLGFMDPLSSTSSSSPRVSVVPSELVFNHKESSSFSTSSTSSQCVSITNHTRGKLCLWWTASQNSPFSVSPSSCDLGPLKATSFIVTYDPKQLNTLHAAQLECFAYYKNNDHTEERLLCPPWCLTVRVIGHSFQLDKEHFIPRCSLKPPRVVFPSLSVLSYRTILLQNYGDQPLTFCLNHSSGPAESISLVPSCGLIQPGSHQILTLRTTPTEDSPRQGFGVCLQLNAAEHTKEFTVFSVVEKLRVSLEGDGSLCFDPTAVGSRMQRSHHIRNLSNLPLRFQWSVPEPDQRLIHVEPEAGELHPNESSAQIWSFSPLAEKTYTLTPTLTFWPIQTPGCSKSQTTLNVVGMGCRGFIEAVIAALDVGEILVGSCRAVDVPLVNDSLCPVSFCLSVQQTLLDEETVCDPEPEPALQLKCEKGTITSHSTMLLRSTIRPHRRAQYLWTISYQTLNASGCASSSPVVVCEVRAKGVFPILKVIDVCGFGSVSSLSKMHLWNLFSLDSLNEHLLSGPSPAEIIHKTPRRHRPCPSMLDFNLSAAPLNSEPSTFALMFHNPGAIPVEWSLLFPEEEQLEFQYWVETGQLSSMELSQMKIQDNQLFSISPRSGTLLPGQQRAVHFRHSHDFTGTDRFPVVFKLSHGSEILLNLQGVTVDRDRSYLHFASERHVFTSVTTGDRTPPRQVYELHNAGAVPVHYQVDLAVLSRLQEDNFNSPVLSCLNPEGEVPPGKTAVLEWIFSPLEAKMYHMDIPIYVQGGDSTPVRFEGCGLNPTAPDSKSSLNCSETKELEPCVQRRPFPGQVVRLSEESVSLGHIPVCSRSSRILFLTNTSHTDSYHYAWDDSVHQVVRIHPQRGSLCPGESALCVLTFTSTDYPTCHQLDVVCEVIHEAVLTRYHDALQRWEKEKKRQQNEFIITDKKLAGRQWVLIEKEPANQGPPLRKYKTLPPICETAGNICSKRTERRAQREAAKTLRRPEAPQPLLLHLGITANSHGLLEYLIRFPDQINKHYRCNQSFKPQKHKATFSSASLPAELPSLAHGPVRTITTHVLKSLLRSIFDDPAFTQLLIMSTSKPTAPEHKDPAPSHCSSLPSSVPSPPSHSTPKQPTLSRGTPCEQRQQHNSVGTEGTAGCSGNGPRTQNTPHTVHVPADRSEDVLLETLQNLMVEAVRGEFDLTAHPSTLTLPPVSTRRRSETAAEERESLKN